MKTLRLVSLLALFFTIVAKDGFSQTQWKGETSVNWAIASNWTNGVPTATTDVVIGDANFTGAFQPAISSSSTAKSLTIGGAVPSQLTIANTLSIKGNININPNGNIIHGNGSVSLTGDWINEGNYSATSTTATIIFAGINQSVSGNVETVFRKLTINTGSILSLNSNLTCSGTSSALTVNGTLNPNEPTTHLVTADSMVVNSRAVLKVNASDFNLNYQVSKPVLLNAGSIVEYSSTLINQSISNAFAYSTLRISGDGKIKSLSGDLPLLRSTSSGVGYIYVLSGTLDLGNYNANRGTTVAGGILIVYNGAFLKIGGTKSFPTGFTTNTLSLSSTVEYNGGNQSISGRTYGNLALSSSSGAAIKTMPATAFTVTGSLTSNIGSGTSVSFAAASNITITGSLNIGTSTTFDGGTSTHLISGNWYNTGTFNPGTSTISMLGANATIGGSSTQNFNNLSISGPNISAPSITSLNISGNLATSRSGSFIHPSPGTLTMTGNAKTITGINIALNNLNVPGVVTSTSTTTIAGNMNVSGSLITTAGMITMSGVGKTLTNSGILSMSTFKVTGSVTTSSDFTVSISLINTGTFTAPAGTITFNGSATLTGIFAFYNITISGRYLRLAANTVLGISNGLQTLGTAYLNVTTYIPNTVNYNGTQPQLIKNTSYNNLILSNGNIKTAQGAIIVNNALTISPSTTFDAATFTHTMNGNWVNNGNLIANTSTIQFLGVTNTTISGPNTFFKLTINKTASSNTVTLLQNVETSIVTTSRGILKTGSKIITITNTHTTSAYGVILGTITRSHPFVAGTAYAFEGPYSTIKFGTVSGINSVTVNTTVGNVNDFPNGGSIGRVYTITIPSGTYTGATLRLHYEDAELNGNDETKMQLWRYNGAAWGLAGKTTNVATSNYVEKIGLSDISNRWSFSDDGSVLAWNGSVSSDWNTAGNWSLVQGVFSGVPGATDIVQVGKIPFTNQPVISSVVKVKGIVFGSTREVLLSLSTGGTLTVDGTIQGNWTSNASHIIKANNLGVTIMGDLILSDGIAGHTINMDMGTGPLIVNGSITQSGGANIGFVAGSLKIGQDFNYLNGTFTPGTGTVTYSGSESQTLAPVPYHNLTITKTAGSTATISDVTTIAGNLFVTSGELDIFNSLSVMGSVTISAAGIVEAGSNAISVGGNWTQTATATFKADAGSVLFIGSGTQTISASTFNNLSINKASGTVTLSGNIDVNGDLSLLSGILNLSTYTINQTGSGDTFLMTDGTTLNVSGADNFPANFTNYDLGKNSTVHYNGAIAQIVDDVTYGDLIFSNGGVLEKEFSVSSIINGDLVINNGASVNGKSAVITLNGHWINNGGIFIPGTSSLLLNGLGKTLTGNTIFNDFTVNGSYSVVNNDMTFNGEFLVTNTGSYNAGSGVATVNGDFTNSGYAFSSGTTSFSGNIYQTIRLVNALVSTSTGIVNFNGSVSPDFNSTTAPTFATLNINNTSGINPSVDWLVLVAFNVNSGAIFNGGGSTHTIKGSFTNNGTVTSTGVLDFEPYSAVNLKLNGTKFSSTGKVIFGGTGQSTITGTPTLLQDVVIANTNSAGITASSAWKMNGDFSINSNAIFNAGSFLHSVGGDIESDGILNGNTSTFTMSSPSGQLTGSPGTLFNNFTINGNVTANSDFNVTGNFTNNGMYDGSLGALIMIGNNNSVIGGTTIPSSISQLTISKDPGSMVTANVDINSVSALIVNSGIFFTSTKTISQGGIGGALVVMGGATLKIGGINTLPAFSGYGLDEESTVDYAGADQTIAQAGSGYGNLIISAPGNKTATSFVPLTIAGNLTITAGNFVANDNTHKLAGNWIMTGGTFTNTNSVIHFNGFENQNIQSIAPFNSVTIFKYGGVITLSNDITINKFLTFTKSNIQTGNYKVIIPATGSVVGAGQNKGWVNGNLQKGVATGAGVSRIFEIGDSTYYTPSTILFSSVGTAGNVVVKVSATDHPEGDYSGIDTTKSVNRYWSLTNAGVGFTTAAITFNWVASDVDAGANYLNFKTAVYNGSNWLLNNVASALTKSIQATGVTGLGDFQIGESINKFVWTGNSLNSDWNTNSNWSGGIPSGAFNVFIPAGLTNGKVYPVLNSGTGIVKNLIIENAASLTVENATLQISESITNSGMLDAVKGIIELNGSNAQVITANTFRNNAVNHLIINNSHASGVALNGDLDIYGSLTYSGSGRIFNTNDYLTLKSTALNTAWIGDMTGNSITGKVTVEKYLSGHKAWRFLSIPTNTNQTIKQAWQENSTNVGDDPKAHYGTQVTSDRKTWAAEGFDLYSAGGPSMKTYNSLTDKWVGISSTNALNINSSSAYLVFVRGDRLSNAFNSPITETTLRTKGELYTGTQPAFALVPGKFTAVGNPYAAPLNFSKISKGNGVDDIFYVWDPFISGSYNLGGYQTMSAVDGYKPHPGGSTAYPKGTPAPNIQSGQAFFMHATSVNAIMPVNYSIIITESAKSGGTVTGGQIARGGSGGGTINKRQLFEVTLFTGSNATDKVADNNVVAFDPVFSNDVDGYDALKIKAGGENFDIRRNGKMLVVEARSELTANDTIYYNMTNMAQKNYQLRFAPENMHSAGMQAFLTDKFLNQESPVSLFDSTFINISVTSNALSKAADRFSVIFRPLAILPVMISSLKATLKDADILVEWKVENELNISKYEVEKSADGIDFSKAANVPVTNDRNQSYKWLDKNASFGYHYYRVKAVDVNGQTSVTQIVKVLIGTGVAEISVYPNPIVNEVINVQLTNQPKGQYQIRLINPLGQVVIKKEIGHSGGSANETLKWNRNFAKGIYQLEITHPGGELKVIKVVH